MVNLTLHELMEENEKLVKMVQRLQAELRLLKIDNERMQKILGMWKPKK